MSLHKQIRHRSHLVYRPDQIVQGFGIQLHAAVVPGQPYRQPAATGRCIRRFPIQESSHMPW